LKNKRVRGLAVVRGRLRRTAVLGSKVALLRGASMKMG
jgi:hypothetical protein